MIGKDAGHNKVLISKNDHPQISPRKPEWGHNDPGSIVDGVKDIGIFNDESVINIAGWTA